jgi:hypothetical protein
MASVNDIERLRHRVPRPLGACTPGRVSIAGPVRAREKYTLTGTDEGVLEPPKSRGRRRLGRPFLWRWDDQVMGKPRRSPSTDTVLRDALKIAARIMNEMSEQGDDEELAMCLTQLDELLRLERAPIPLRWTGGESKSRRRSRKSPG